MPFHGRCDQTLCILPRLHHSLFPGKLRFLASIASLRAASASGSSSSMVAPQAASSIVWHGYCGSRRQMPLDSNRSYICDSWCGFALLVNSPGREYIIQRGTTHWWHHSYCSVRLDAALIQRRVYRRCSIGSNRGMAKDPDAWRAQYRVVCSTRELLEAKGVCKQVLSDCWMRVAVR